MSWHNPASRDTDGYDWMLGWFTVIGKFALIYVVSSFKCLCLAVNHCDTSYSTCNVTHDNALLLFYGKFNLSVFEIFWQYDETCCYPSRIVPLFDVQSSLHTLQKQFCQSFIICKHDINSWSISVPNFLTEKQIMTRSWFATWQCGDCAQQLWSRHCY